MVLVKVPENRKAEMFIEFYDQSMFTFEGLDISDETKKREFKDIFEKLARRTGFTEKEMIGYLYKGCDMNEVFGLIGNNAYQDDLTFVSIPNYYNPVIKLQIGARWFDDIIDNNARRQNYEH